MTNSCLHKFKRQEFFVSILLLRSSNPRFDAHKFKASKLTWVDNRMIIRPPCLFLMRKVAKPQVLTEGEKDISFEILNQWISKRKLEISLNRIETQNPCPLSLWGHGFAFVNTVVAASRHCRQNGSSWKRAQPVDRRYKKC